jgi:hypothetical protein
MKLRGLIIAVIVLAALTGALYWSNHHKPEESPDAAADAPPKILQLNPADISRFELKRKSGEDVTLQKDSAGKWQMTSPAPFKVDQAAVTSLLGTFSILNGNRMVDDKPTNLVPYGLSPPVLEADLTEKNNAVRKLLIGTEAPTGNAVYVKTDADPSVYTMPSYNKTSIDKTADDLRDKRLLGVEPEKISQVDLLAKNQDIEFARTKDGWQIVKPKPERADSDQVDEFVRKLTEARMDLGDPTADPKKLASAFAAGTPVATARITDASGTKELQVRKNKDDYYAKSSAVDGIYKVASDLGQSLDKSVDDFRNKKLFDFGFNDPNKVEIYDGSQAYYLSKGGEDWWSADGKKWDANAAQTVIDDLRNLAAAKFVESGFATSVMNISVTSNDGKRVEKISIAKNGGGYMARREGDTTLYALDAKPVEDLQNAEKELKVAAAPAQKR